MTDRVLGEEIAISVATAQIFELTLTQEIPYKPDGVIFNVRTLWRNFWEAYDKDTRPITRNLVEPFFEELEVIAGLMVNIGIQHYFYWPEYRGLFTKFPGSVPKPDEKKTANAVIFDASEALIAAEVKRRKAATILDLLLPNNNGNFWLVSHLPIDLFNRYQFSSLKLLQSHTGRLIEPIGWNKTIFANERYHRMPFNVFTFSIFGDRSKMFSGHPIRIRKAVFQLAEENHWTPLTTIEKIRYDIKKVTDTDLKKILVKALEYRLS